MSIDLSVVIPTYNRSSILQQTLAALAAQASVAVAWEVIVIDDGSTDDTPEAVAALAPSLPAPLRYMTQPNRGAGAARNSGLKLAIGDLVLFLDSDITAAPGLLLAHLVAHRQRWPARNAAVLGRVVLAPDVPATGPNLHHVVHQWCGLSDGQELPWQHFITCNISLKRSFLLDHELLFDEELRAPAYEDTELGYRCAQYGQRIFYCTEALGYHQHDLNVPSYLRMSQRYGEAAALLHHRHPGLQSVVGSYLAFSWRNPARQVLHDLVRSLVLNRWTVPALRRLAVTICDETHAESPARRALRDWSITRLAAYYERSSYHTQRRALKHQTATQVPR